MRLRAVTVDGSAPAARARGARRRRWRTGRPALAGSWRRPFGRRRRPRACRIVVDGRGWRARATRRQLRGVGRQLRRAVERRKLRCAQWLVIDRDSVVLRAIFERLLSERRVTVLLDSQVRHATEAALHCVGGRAVAYDEAIWCTQGGAQEWLRETALALDADGFIAVHPTLESVSTPGVFACGDVAAVLEHPRPKAGVWRKRK